MAVSMALRFDVQFVPWASRTLGQPSYRYGYKGGGGYQPEMELIGRSGEIVLRIAFFHFKEVGC